MRRRVLILYFRFNKLLFVIDTCQANTMYSKFYSPNLISTGSSGLGESSYSVSKHAVYSARNITDTTSAPQRHGYRRFCHRRVYALHPAIPRNAQQDLEGHHAGSGKSPQYRLNILLRICSLISTIPFSSTLILVFRTNYHRPSRTRYWSPISLAA